MIKRFLVVLDDLEPHDVALEVARGIANHERVEFILLYTLKEKNERVTGSVERKEILLNSELRGTIHKLNTLMKNLTKDGITAISRLCDGYLVDNILDVAGRENPDMIVMHRLPVFEMDGLKKLMEKVPCPLLTIPKVPMEFKNSIFTIFQLEGVMEKYAIAQPILTRNDMCVHLVAYPEMHESDSLVKLLSQMEEKLVQDSISYSIAACLTNDIPGSLVDMAGRNQIDLIVLSNSAPNGVRDFNFSNYAHQIIDESPSAVLFINSVAILKNQLVEN